MPRTVNEHEYAVKRNEILDAAQRLVLTRGYEQMTIQDVIAGVGISKGAFYHYFGSKQALREGLIERVRQEGEQLILAILEDPSLPALTKLQRYFDTAGRWKSAQKAYLLALLQVWYADDNAVVRQKVQAAMLEHLAPALSRVVIEGHAEGVFTTPFPDQAGRIVTTLLFSCGEACGQLLLASPRQPDTLARAERLVEAHNYALERVLGAPPGSLHLIDSATLAEWFVSTEVEVG